MPKNSATPTPRADWLISRCQGCTANNAAASSAVRRPTSRSPTSANMGTQRMPKKANGNRSHPSPEDGKPPSSMSHRRPKNTTG
jgi:hypothetical protein